jgi:hypothetical protein
MSDHLQRNQLTLRVAAFVVLMILLCGGVFLLFDHWRS